MTNLIEETKQLLENAASYTIDQKDKFVEEASTLYKQISKKIESLSVDAQTEINPEYEPLAAELESLKSAADDKQLELRVAFAKKIENLHSKLEKDASKE